MKWYSKQLKKLQEESQNKGMGGKEKRSAGAGAPKGKSRIQKSPVAQKNINRPKTDSK